MRYASGVESEQKRPDDMPEQGVIINGEFVEARMMSAELVADHTAQQIGWLKDADDDDARAGALRALLRTVQIYGKPAIDTLAAAGLTPEQLQTDLDALGSA